MKAYVILMTSILALGTCVSAKPKSNKKPKTLSEFVEQNEQKKKSSANERFSRLESEFRRFVSDFFDEDMPHRSPLIRPDHAHSWYKEAEAPTTQFENIDPDATVHIIRLNLSGFSASDIEVIRHQKNRTLTVKAEHVEDLSEQNNKGGSFWTSSMQTFQHSFELPPNAKMDAISNTFSDGVLTITVPLEPQNCPVHGESDNMLIFELPGTGKK